MITTFKNHIATIGAARTAAGTLQRRLAQQTALQRGQNLQMLDFAELGPPSLRAHLALPELARRLPSSRAVSRVLTGMHWMAEALAWILTLLGALGLALLLTQITSG